MNFSYYDFGYLEKGKIVEVQLSAAANVRLMDSTNYSNYKNGRKHRYVDWEVKASLQQGATLPNGLIAINLPYMGSEGALPERVSENVKRDANGNEVGYARYYVYPDSKQKLYDWIEDAYAARTTRSNLIKNPNEMMHYNAKCRRHGVTH